jgi:hypothetical protein
MNRLQEKEMWDKRLEMWFNHEPLTEGEKNEKEMWIKKIDVWLNEHENVSNENTSKIENKTNDSSVV